MNKILCVGGEADKHLGVFNDLIDFSKDVDVLYIQPKYRTGIMGLICRVLLSARLNDIIPIPSFVKYLFYNISSCDCRNYDIILFVNGSLSSPFICRFLKKCKKRNVKIVLYVLDCLSSGSPVLKKTARLIKSSIWSEVFTFDINDAQLYGFKYIGLFYYSMLNNIQIFDNPKYDLYFTGGLKGGREKMIEDAFIAGKNNQTNLSFDVMTYNRDDVNYIDGIEYRNYWISYETIVENVCSSNCILDICQNNQVGPSFRYFEAVCYNRKLLTNNPNIKTLPYYNPKWMRIFSDVENIDWDWVKVREDVQYNYNGDFSPKKLIEFLNKYY